MNATSICFGSALLLPFRELVTSTVMNVYLVVEIVGSGIVVGSRVGCVVVTKQIILITFGRTIRERRKPSASLCT